MSDLPSLPVDLSDPKDIRAKLPRAERILERLEREVAASQDRLARWLLLVEGLRSVAGATTRTSAATEATAAASAANVGSPPATEDETSDTAKAAGRAQMQDLVVGRLNEHGQPIRSRDLHRMLVEEGHPDLTPDSVSNALWYAAERLRTARKLGHGVYAPLGWHPDASEISPDADGQDEGASTPSFGMTALRMVANAASAASGA
jgi:hypothetical protein